MAHIIGLIQVKGGVGRSTIAANLAGLIAHRKQVALIDCDMPQGTSAAWATIRGSGLTIATATDHMQLVDEVKRLNESHDYIVIDAPPRIAEITKVALILSKLCIVPLGATMPDIWATTDLLKTIEQAKALKPEVNARILWNKYRETTRSAKELSQAVHEQLGLKELTTKLGYRVAYSDAFAEGKTVAEWTDRAAKDELKALGREIEKLMRVKFMGDE